MPEPDAAREATDALCSAIHDAWIRMECPRTLLPREKIATALRTFADAQNAELKRHIDEAGWVCLCDESKPNGKDLCPKHCSEVVMELRRENEELRKACGAVLASHAIKRARELDGGKDDG